MSRLVPIAAALVALTLVRAEPACSQSMDVSRPAGTEAGAAMLKPSLAQPLHRRVRTEDLSPKQSPTGTPTGEIK